MKRLLVLLAIAGGFITHAYGQTYPGQLPANTVLGNSTGSPVPLAVPGQVTNGQMAPMAAGTSKCRLPGIGSGSPQDCTTTFVSVSDFGASGSGLNTTGTISATSTSLAISSSLDFVNGQGIRVNHAGAAFSLSAPTGCSATPQGTSGATTYQYQVATLDGFGGVGAATATFQTTTGNATLSATNFNKIACTSAVGAAGYAVYRNISSTFTLVGVVFQANFAFNDYNYGVGALGAPDFLPSTAQGSSLADWLITSVASGGGTTNLTLANAATTAASSQGVFHDDTTAVSNAIASSSAVIFKCGNYNISSQLTVSWPNGSSIYGFGPACSNIQKISPGSDLFHFSGGNFNNIGKMSIVSSEYQTGGYIFDFLAGASSNNRITDVLVSGGSNIVFFGSGGGQNFIDRFIFNNFNTNGITWASGFGGADTVSNGGLFVECLINGGWSAGAFGAGLLVQAGNVFTFSNLNVACQNNPIFIQPALGQIVSDVQAVNVAADGFQSGSISRVSGGNGWTLDGSLAGATLQRIRCFACWAGTNVGNGFALLDVHSFVCGQCESYNNGQAGMEINSSESVNIVGSQFIHNSTSSSGTFNGINADTNSAKIMISSSELGVNAQFPSGIQKYGVQSDSTVSNIALCNNVSTGNLTGGYNLNGVTSPTCTNQ